MQSRLLEASQNAMCRIVYIRKKKDKEEHAFFYFREKQSMMLVSVQV
jgi:hypothetical protein